MVSHIWLLKRGSAVRSDELDTSDLAVNLHYTLRSMKYLKGVRSNGTMRQRNTLLRLTHKVTFKYTQNLLSVN